MLRFMKLVNNTSQKQRRKYAIWGLRIRSEHPPSQACHEVPGRTHKMIWAKHSLHQTVFVEEKPEGAHSFRGRKTSRSGKTGTADLVCAPSNILCCKEDFYFELIAQGWRLARRTFSFHQDVQQTSKIRGGLWQWGRTPVPRRAHLAAAEAKLSRGRAVTAATARCPRRLQRRDEAGSGPGALVRIKHHLQQMMMYFTIPVVQKGKEQVSAFKSVVTGK